MIKVVTLDGIDEVVKASEGYSQVVLAVKNGTSEKKLDVILDEEGCEVEVLGAYLLEGYSKVNLVVNTIHTVPNTKCLTQIRAVLKDNSYSSFKGTIKIEKQGVKTNSYLDDDVLILGDAARNESEPTLEILTDDVKATHGATTGRISDEHLFYLQSRGLSVNESENLIVEGFLESVISKIKDAKISEDLRKDLCLSS